MGSFPGTDTCCLVPGPLALCGPALQDRACRASAALCRRGRVAASPPGPRLLADNSAPVLLRCLQSHVSCMFVFLGLFLEILRFQCPSAVLKRGPRPAHAGRDGENTCVKGVSVRPRRGAAGGTLAIGESQHSGNQVSPETHDARLCLDGLPGAQPRPWFSLRRAQPSLSAQLGSQPPRACAPVAGPPAVCLVVELTPRGRPPPDTAPPWLGSRPLATSTLPSPTALKQCFVRWLSVTRAAALGQ